MPRLTWMRDRLRLLEANRWLEEVHGGDMLLEATWRRSVRQVRRMHDGLRLLRLDDDRRRLRAGRLRDDRSLLVTGRFRRINPDIR